MLALSRVLPRHQQFTLILGESQVRNSQCCKEKVELLILVSQWCFFVFIRLEVVACLQSMWNESLAFQSTFLGGWQQAWEQPLSAYGWSPSPSGIWCCLEGSLLPAVSICWWVRQASLWHLSMLCQLWWWDATGFLSAWQPWLILRRASRMLWETQSPRVTSEVKYNLKDWAPSRHKLF